MKLVICMDSWKGSLTAEDACESVARGLATEFPDAEIIQCPLADGGEGTLDLVHALQTQAQRVDMDVVGPRPDFPAISSAWLHWPAKKQALVEMALASGITLVDEADLDPMLTTTWGTGQLIADALRCGVEKLMLAVGGSATVDGGLGMASALGWRFLAASGCPVAIGGRGLLDIDRIVPPAHPLPAVDVEVFCDVDNPLTGPRGAAAVFGPQKKATPHQVAQLDEGLKRFAKVVKRDLGIEINNLSGAGAAGGIAGAAVAFLGAKLVPGSQRIVELAEIDAKLRGADWVICGEGSLDRQSMQGKVLSAVSKLARKNHTRIAVLAGRVDLSAEEAEAVGVEQFIEASPRDIAFSEIVLRAEEYAELAAQALAERLASSSAS